VEGSSNNKALEIFNGTGAAVALGDYSVLLFTNGALTPSRTLVLSGTLPDQTTFVLCNGSSNPVTLLPLCDITTNTVTTFNGDDGIQLVKAGLIVDSIGNNTDPGTSWGTGMTTTQDHTLRRKCTVTSGDTDFTDAFDPTVQWDIFPVDTFSYLGSRGCGGGSSSSSSSGGGSSSAAG